ncbi:MAG: hypothetical protein HQ567_02120 [Candidatus Nealsonbacteria bacterium]|nr:hypothetical protein [Candidatus Nealsonbacteria bacterium]
MDGWDVALLVAAGYIAVTALVRLMIRRRDQLVEHFRRDVKKEKSRQRAERQRAQRDRVA